VSSPQLEANRFKNSKPGPVRDCRETRNNGPDVPKRRPRILRVRTGPKDRQPECKTLQWTGLLKGRRGRDGVGLNRTNAEIERTGRWPPELQGELPVKAQPTDEQIKSSRRPARSPAAETPTWQAHAPQKGQMSHQEETPEPRERRDRPWTNKCRNPRHGHDSLSLQPGKAKGQRPTGQGRSPSR